VLGVFSTAWFELLLSDVRVAAGAHMFGVLAIVEVERQQPQEDGAETEAAAATVCPFARFMLDDRYAAAFAKRAVELDWLVECYPLNSFGYHPICEATRS
jgi:hypothetical protein